MSLYILVALLNGLCIALSRILNGQLCQTKSAFRASTINHLVGFVFLTLLILLLSLVLTSSMVASLSTFTLPADPLLYTGGMIGALYVAVNSYIMTRLGSTNAMILVIAGQMLFGVTVEFITDEIQNLPLQLAGVALIIIGIWFIGNVDRRCR